MNQVRISGVVVSVARHQESLHFLLKFRVNTDGYVRVKVLAPLLVKQLANFQAGCFARVVGWLKDGDDGLFIEAFNIITQYGEVGHDSMPPHRSSKKEETNVKTA